MEMFNSISGVTTRQLVRSSMAVTHAPGQLQADGDVVRRCPWATRNLATLDFTDESRNLSQCSELMYT